jgi:phytoene dehydrogenase-like protein
MNAYDAIVVGSGPNGLAAAITLAREGLSVLVLEANDTPGGGARTEALTLPGFLHDTCSSIFPMAVASPFFRSLNLDVDWIQPEIAVAHPLEKDRAAWLTRSLDSSPEPAYRRLMEPLVANWEPLTAEILQPMLHFPKHPIMLSQLGLPALRSAESLARSVFKSEETQALFAGLAAHSFLRLDETASAAIGLVLAMTVHAVGWPMPRGGAGQITNALVSTLEKLGGKIETGRRVHNLDELPPTRAILCDVSPRQLLALAGNRLPDRYAAVLTRFHPGPGVFKIDYALNAPIPWSAPACRKAGTVHVGGSFDEIHLSEAEVAAGKTPEHPFVLVAQHSSFDNTRASAGKHTAWAYCHVPNGSDADMTTHIEAQIERFAPGFRDCILARTAQNCRALEQKNANLIGGDISGGLNNLWQMIARPILSPHSYRTPVKGLYLCSASTPPGGGVHGMCGFNAAKDALREVFRKKAAF